MSRRKSRLGVLIRLAKLEEDRTLQELGRSRMQVERVEGRLQQTDEQLAYSSLAAVLRSGSSLTADGLAAHNRTSQGLALVLAQTREQLEGARGVEETARTYVIEAKRKLRGLRSAEERRKKRERLLERRAEIRRMDEVQRNLSRLKDEQ